MTAGRLTPYDIYRRVMATVIALTGVAVFVVGVAMFWGPLRQVLAAPVAMALGVMVYVGGRTMWWFVEEDLRARP